MTFTSFVFSIYFLKVFWFFEFLDHEEHSNRNDDNNYNRYYNYDYCNRVRLSLISQCRLNSDFCLIIYFNISLVLCLLGLVYAITRNTSTCIVYYCNYCCVLLSLVFHRSLLTFKPQACFIDKEFAKFIGCLLKVLTWAAFCLLSILCKQRRLNIQWTIIQLALLAETVRWALRLVCILLIILAKSNNFNLSVILCFEE